MSFAKAIMLLAVGALAALALCMAMYAVTATMHGLSNTRPASPVEVLK